MLMVLMTLLISLRVLGVDEVVEVYSVLLANKLIKNTFNLDLSLIYLSYSPLSLMPLCGVSTIYPHQAEYICSLYSLVVLRISLYIIID